MQNLEIYCVTDKENFLKNELQTRAIGKFSSRYIKRDNKDNIFHKEKNYLS